MDLSAETVARTNIRASRTAWAEGRRVNLERALRLGDELGGHIVSGHVDGLAEILEVRPRATAPASRFRAPDALARFIAPKGSVALNGTSLTVNEVEGASFGVNIIPHTLRAHHLGRGRRRATCEPRDRHAGALRGAAGGVRRRETARPGLTVWRSRGGCAICPRTTDRMRMAELKSDFVDAISSIEEIIEDARNGRMFILVDHEDRENEGDLVIPAQMCTPDAVNFMATHGRGLICLTLHRRAARRARAAADGAVELLAARDRLHRLDRGARGRDDRHLRP